MGETETHSDYFSCDDEFDDNAYEEDRLSTLPDPLLVDILSLLPLESAAATSVLSRRWHHLWTELPHLYLDVYNPTWLQHNITSRQQKFHKFKAIVEHVLNQLTSPLIQTFYLRIPDPLNSSQLCSTSLNSWIRLIYTRNVTRIKLVLNFGPNSSYVYLPNCIFQIKSLVELHLGGRYLFCKLPLIESHQNVVSLPKLNKLELFDIDIDPFQLRTLIKSCPLLEVLLLDLCSYKVGVVDISAQNLKSLSIMRNLSSISIVIDAPMLERFVLDGELGSITFVKYPSKLFEVDIFIWDFFDFYTQIPQLFQVVSSVKYLNLFNGLQVFSALNDLDVDVGSIFGNLIHLGLDLSSNEVGSDDRNPIPLCLLRKLKRIKLLNMKGNANDMKLLKYILYNANVLEQLYVSSVDDDDDTFGYEKDKLWWEYKISKTLVAAPKILSCEIKYVGNYIRATCDRSQNGLVVKIK